MADRTTGLATKIVAAYVGNNTLTISDIPDLIQAAYTALVRAISPAPAPVEAQPPAVAVKKSVTPGAIICLECGKSQKMLKRHLLTAHDLTVDDYRAKWSLPADYPMVAPDYAARRSELAKASGLGFSRKNSSKAAPSPDGPASVEVKPRHSYPASRWSKPNA